MISNKIQFENHSAQNALSQNRLQQTVQRKANKENQQETQNHVFEWYERKPCLLGAQMSFNKKGQFLTFNNKKNLTVTSIFLYNIIILTTIR